MKCDLHIHSQFSDGRLSIPEIVDLYGRQGFGAIAITDHLCEKQNIIGKVSHGLSYTLTQDSFVQYMKVIKNEAERAWKQYEMLLVPGYEVTKNSFANHRSAHFLVLGIEEYINPELSVMEILDIAKSLGAMTIAAHPFPTGEIEFQTLQLWSQRQKFKHYIDAWEVNSRKNISEEVLRSGLPIIANSDFHHQKHFGSWKTKVHCEKNQAALFKNIKAQNIDFFLDKDLSLSAAGEGLGHSRHSYSFNQQLRIAT